MLFYVIARIKGSHDDFKEARIKGSNDNKEAHDNVIDVAVIALTGNPMKNSHFLWKSFRICFTHILSLMLNFRSSIGCLRVHTNCV